MNRKTNYHRIKNTLIIILLSIFISGSITGQVTVEMNLNLELAEKDTITSARLERSLNGFLAEAKENDYSEKHVDTTHLRQYEFFFSKLAGIGIRDYYHNPLVLKSYPVEEGSYRLTVGFTGVKEGEPFIYQITELKAIPYQEGFRFYCPFEDNTHHFQAKKIDNVTYHFSKDINVDRATEFVEFTQNLATLTKNTIPEIDYYSFNSLDELLKSYGFLYSARQCNFLCYDLGFTDNAGKTYITGTNNENYVFGFIGDYLYYNLPDNEKIYWPYVQGISTYYGGYGLSYDDMDDLKNQFRNKLKEVPDIDFLEEFRKGRKSSVNRHFSYFVMSAFLFEKILNEKGFDDALKLVYSGNEGDQFFEYLDEVMKINEDNFHQTIVEIIGVS